MDGHVTQLDLANEIQGDIRWGCWKSGQLDFNLRECVTRTAGRHSVESENEAGKEEKWRQNNLWWYAWVPELSCVSQEMLYGLSQFQLFFCHLPPIWLTQ